MFNNKKDIRIRILEHFYELEGDTEEVIANDWLSRQSQDLGTIRRALMELVNSELVSLSNREKEKAVDWLRSELDTTTISSHQTKDDKYKKSSRRLIESVGMYPKVKKIRIHTTIKGITFLQQYRRDKNSNFRSAFWILFSGITGFLSKVIYDFFFN